MTKTWIYMPSWSSANKENSDITDVDRNVHTQFGGLFCTFTVFITILKRARNNWWGWTMMLSPQNTFVTILIYLLGHWECDSHTVHKFMKLYLIVKWIFCLWMHSEVLWSIVKWYQSFTTSSKNIQGSWIHSWQTSYFFFFYSFCRYISSEPILTFSSLYNGSQLELLTLSSPRTIQNWTLSPNSVSNLNAFTCSNIFQPLFKYTGINVFLKLWLFSFTFFHIYMGCYHCNHLSIIFLKWNQL